MITDIFFIKLHCFFPLTHFFKFPKTIILQMTVYVYDIRGQSENNYMIHQIRTRLKKNRTRIKLNNV